MTASVLACVLAASHRAWAALQIGSCTAASARGWCPFNGDGGPRRCPRERDPDDLTGSQATTRLVDFVEQARALALAQRNQFLKDGLTPSVEGGQLLSSGKQLLIDNAKWALERSLRILLGKTPIQRFGWHALSPESARRNMRLDSRQKCVRCAI